MKKFLSLFLVLCIAVTLLSVSVRAADTSEKLIAFTFDDGPSIYTDRLLDALAKNDAHATFFVSGYRLKEYSDELGRIVSEGHEAANHTQNHKTLTKLSAKELANEVDTELATLKKVGGDTRYLLRPVGGSYNQAVRNAARGPVIIWSVDTLDWKNRDSDAVYKNIMTAKDGDIVLMHDLYKTTVAAVERALPDLKAKGFKVVTVTELFRRKGITLENGEVYNSARKYSTLPEISAAPVYAALPTAAASTPAESDGTGYAAGFTAASWKAALANGVLSVTSPLGGVYIPTEAKSLAEGLSESDTLTVRIAPDGDYTAFSVEINGTPVQTVPGGLHIVLHGTGLTSASAVTVKHPGLADTVCAVSGIVDQNTVCAAVDGSASVRIAANRALNFRDTPDWGRNSIDFVSAHDLFNGVSADMFAPNTGLTRGMVVTVLYRMSGQPEVKSAANFKDVKSGMYYAKPIAWAMNAGYVQGMGNNRFAPDNPLTREQLIQMLYNYSGDKGEAVPACSASCSAWAKAAYDWAADAGIITGSDAAWMRPGLAASRGEAAILLYRYAAYAAGNVK